MKSLIKRWFGAGAYVVGYPKCGNTWFEVMLRCALVRVYGLPEDVMSSVLRPWCFGGFSSVPSIWGTHNMPRFNEEASDDLNLDNSIFKGRRVILLIREPKDTLVSLYMHNVHRENPPLFRGDIHAMVNSPVYGIEKYLRYYSTWYEDRKIPAALMLLRYEDLHKQTALQLREALAFLGVPRVTNALVDEVVAYGSLENMRKLEAANTMGLATLAPPERRDENAFKVRKGKVGGYVDYLSPETVGYIDSRVNAALPAFYGYTASKTGHQVITASV